MYQHLSKHVDQVIKLANDIAHEYDQEYIGTEHVLLAIARSGAGVGAAILQAHDATPDKLKEQVDQLIRASLEDTWVFGRLPGTPHFKNVMAKAIEVAGELGGKEVCTQHVLLAMLLEKGSVAYQAMRNLGLSAANVRDEVLRHENED